MMDSIVIDVMTKADWNQVREIYIEGIKTGNATFETKAPSWKDWDAGHLDVCRLVARRDNQVIGWAALSPISNRLAYRGVAEVSIYLSKESTGKGLGSLLIKHLIVESEKEGIWTLQALIFPENQTSIQLHKKFGFYTVGVRKQIGKLHGIWRDVEVLERRSSVVGTD